MKNIFSGHYKYRLLAILWMAILFWLSSQPDLPSPSLFPAEDKLEHLVAFGILGVLFALSLGPWKGSISIKQMILVTTLVTVYGAIDEFHQLFVPGRCASISDLLADFTGGLTASLVLYLKGKGLFHLYTP